MASRRFTWMVLAGTACLAVVGFLVTLTRTPTPWADSQLYASIARSRQLYGSGVPSTHVFSPHAVDHVAFYGPVFFDAVAGSFDLFGVSEGSARLVSLLGALLLAGAGAWLARLLSDTCDRWLWALALLLLTPEIGTAATSGDMETTAVGLEMMALALFVAGRVTATRRLWYGVGAGLILTLAALTTPRTYPFIVGFFVAGAVLMLRTPGARRAAWLQLAASAAVVATGLAIWGTMSQGSPIRWARYMIFILSREDTDVAVLAGATRMLSFNWTSAVTPFFAIAGVLAAGPTFMRRADRPPREEAARFALLTTCIAGLLIVFGMNYTFTLGMYFAVPVFAALLAWPSRYVLTIDRRVVIAGVVLVLACDFGYAVKKYARVAATWSASDPERIAEFIRQHVPAGAEVAGPDAPYFLVVEPSGARYRAVSDRSVADWSRWVPNFDPSATKAASRVQVDPPAVRFLIWPAADPLPQGYDCARAHKVASYEPPPNYLHLLGPLGDVWPGYSPTALFRLPAGCPSGYDPSGGGKVLVD